nr:hypothetical protein [Tanacetum cinerariifolium]
MMKWVTALEDFSAPHSGSSLAKTLRNVFVNFNLENKIMSITLDNASNSTSPTSKLKLKYKPSMKEFLIESISMDLDFFDDSYATKAKKWFIDSFEDHLDAQEHKQDKSTLETPVDFEEEILDAEVQANETIPLSDEEIALDAASSEGFMSGPSSEEEEVEAEANYGYDVYHDDY